MDVAWIVVVSAALLVFTQQTSDPDRFNGVWLALTVQIAAWAGSLIVISSRSPSGTVRLSDPIALTLVLAVLYMIYPGIAWCQGANLPFGVILPTEAVCSVFYLHALFFVGLTGGCCLSNRRRPVDMRVDLRQLPKSRLLFLFAFIPIVFTALTRVVNGGSLISSKNYGDEWFALAGNIQSARESGGVEYVFYQISSKTWFYPIIAQGLAGGLLLVRATTRSRLWRLATVLALMGVAVLMMLLGNGMRNPALIYILVALAFADALRGPLDRSVVATIAFLALAAFVLFGYIRANRNAGMPDAVQLAYSQYERDAFSEATGEFTAMLAKEAVMMQIAEESGFSGPTYLFRSVMTLIPSQFLPNKLDWETGAEVLSKRLLGSVADAGAGVAGTAVGDGYAFAGAPGVFLLAGLFGVALGRVQAWALRPPPGRERPVLLKIGLAAGLTGFSFVLIRGDLSQLVVCLVYMIALPWFVLVRAPAHLVRNWLRLLPVVRDAPGSRAWRWS